MALILTFLGSEGADRSVVAIATAKRLAAEGKRVLLAFQDPGPAPSLLLGHPLSADPAAVGDRLQAVQFRSATLLERSWDEVKDLEARYLRTPLLKSVYGQELGVLPGMDSALALNRLRQIDQSGQYDAIVYDGSGDLATLRMLGMPEVLDWYVRRFRDVFQQSDLGKALGPFIPPVAAAVLAVDWSGNVLDQPTGEVRSILEEGKSAINDPNRVMALLVTRAEEAAIATSRFLWGSAQQVGLSVGGVIFRGEATPADEASFAPLPMYSLPLTSGTVSDWQPLMAALPDPQALAQSAPRPVTIDPAAGTVSLFLPSFDKAQVKLIQSGPEVTIEAGDQRRNLLLPPALAGRPVKGAKFQDQYLVLTFG
jgi:anion-transporting  ArsA/GET3 family ATPase